MKNMTKRVFVVLLVLGTLVFAGCRGPITKPSVVSRKRLDLFSFVFTHSRLSATGLDLLQRLFAAT